VVVDRVERMARVMELEKSFLEKETFEHLADGAEGGGDENGENLGVGKALFNPEV
jgi:hypothetical protein